VADLHRLSPIGIGGKGRMDAEGCLHRPPGSILEEQISFDIGSGTMLLPGKWLVLQSVQFRILQCVHSRRRQGCLDGFLDSIDFPFDGFDELRFHAIDPDGALVLAAKGNAKRFVVPVSLPNGVHAFVADFARWR